jgi:hypothetical protein
MKKLINIFTIKEVFKGAGAQIFFMEELGPL